MTEIEGFSPDFRTELAAQLAELAPEAITDGKVDVEKLKELLQGDAEDTTERFGLFWPGKKGVIRAAQTPTSATLAPDRENSKNWDDTHNVFIEGDNLEVLKILQKHYHGKIKMIYIDPPYNTGKDFVYPDNFKDGVDHYLEWSKQVNEDGKPLSTNTETGGRIHTNWLNMMYPRLKLARNLLTEDGVIVMSIDDNELISASVLIQEIFGEDNFVNTVAVKMSESSGVKMSHVTKRLPKVKEYLLIASRRSSTTQLNPVTVPKSDLGSADGYLKYYNKVIENPDDAPETWKITTIKDYLEARDLPADPDSITAFKVENADRVIYRTNNASLASLEFDTPVHRVTSQTGIEYIWWEGKQMLFLSDHLAEAVTDLWTDISTINLNKETHGVRGFGKGQKPLKLIRRLMDLYLDPAGGDTVLDFFAGSGTTGQAVMEASEGLTFPHNFVLVQLPEPVYEKGEQSDAYAYLQERKLPTTISALSRARLDASGEATNTGFRAYKLVDTNFKQWDIQPGATAAEVQQGMLDLRDSARDDATTDELLTELLLKQGMSLTEHVTDTEIAGLDCKTITDADGDIVLLAYVNEHTPPTIDQLRQMVDTKPARLVILEDCFQGNDELKTNLKQMCATHNIELKTA